MEHILGLNGGKRVRIYMRFENRKEWGWKIFGGVMEGAGRDQIIMREGK